MDALRAVRSLGLASWCIGAGVIRSLVWDSLHGFREPSHVQDVDVAYFAPDAAAYLDRELQRQLSVLNPALAWEVTNQAKVHEWLVDDAGHAVPPVDSLEGGLATWPEFATCVGVYLTSHDVVKVVAPYGLNDLFELQVRHNTCRASAATYLERVRSKQFRERWPRLTIFPPSPRSAIEDR
ncbi:hypothetical protein C7R54_07295 [Achromobacter aloeverae]|uniref:Nucleotidyltransferase family protein n=2 Tax=Achromobacter aloeverae TaxID=1750518 RepID=A0A4Q1HMC6_9BURK|nr:nucleotidyltransferase family protein [Achromobacter aloeverae]RXN91651.1 hypothetical protein C7R54_07295 [Achromobacter aloeverae]